MTFTGEADEVALAADGYGPLPLYNDSLEDRGLYVSSIDVELDDSSVRVGTTANPGILTYAVTYSPLSLTAFDLSPLDRPAEIEWEAGIDVTEVVYFDDDDNAIVNSAGELYDPLPTRPVTGGKVRIGYNVASNPANDLMTLKGTANADSFYGAATGTAYISGAGCRKQVETVNSVAITYYAISIEIQFNINKWTYFPIDNGCRVLNDDGDLVAYRDKEGNVATSAVLLDGSGHALEAGDEPVIYPSAGYKVIPQVSWAALDIPDPFA